MRAHEGYSDVVTSAAGGFQRSWLSIALIATPAWAHMGPGLDTGDLVVLAVIGIGIASLVQGALTWLVARNTFSTARLFLRSWGFSALLDIAAVLALVLTDALELDARLFGNRGPPALVLVTPVLMAVSWLAWPLLAPASSARSRLVGSQLLVFTTLGTYVVVMLLLGFNPFAS